MSRIILINETPADTHYPPRHDLNFRCVAAHLTNGLPAGIFYICFALLMYLRLKYYQTRDFNIFQMAPILENVITKREQA